MSPSALRGWLTVRLGLQPDRIGRLYLFLAIAVVQFAANALARTAAEALFLANAGAAALPAYLVIVGITVVPAAAAMSKLIDKVRKVWFYRVSLVIAAGLAVGLRALASTGDKPAWYAVLVGVVLLEMLLNIQFFVLIADYFTTLEQKRLVAALTLATAAGTALGGGFANVLVQLLPTAELLLVFPAFFSLVFVLLLRLQKTEQPFEAPESDARESMQEKLGSLPALLREYPIISLMAIVGFLDVMIGSMGGVLTYNVYAVAFPDEQRLTQVLGTLKGVLAVVQVGVITFVTGPLVQRLGIARMNAIYPLTTLGSLFGLAVKPSLPVAFGASFNWDAVASGLANPVENLTYNAVPPRFLGRVRSVSEGMLQPVGLTVAGLLLAVLVERWSFTQIAWMAVCLSVVHVVLGVYRGRKYADALASQLKSHAVDLSAGLKGSALPAEYAEEIERLLVDADNESSAFGLELAARLGADRFLVPARPVLALLEGRGRQSGVTYLSAIRGRKERAEVRQLLAVGPPRVQALVLEAELGGKASLSARELEPLLASSDATVRGLARAASLRAGGATSPLLLRDPDLGEEGLAAVARGARAAADRRLVPALVEAMVRGTPATRATALEGLVAVAPLGEKLSSVITLAELELESDDPRVRSAAFALLGKEGSAHLEKLSAGTEDSHSRVRRRAAEAMAACGEAAIPYLVAALRSPRVEVVDAALEALGAMRTPDAADAALAYLANDYGQVARNQSWRARMPAGDAVWAPLELALNDSNQRVVDQVLRVLGAFGHARILRHARQALRGRDVRLRANAVEALASITHRRFVLPVMGLLEALATEGDAVEQTRTGAESGVALGEMLSSTERWVRVAAIEVARTLGRELPPEIRELPDPLVRATVDPPEEGTPMSRLLFLRRVSLFQNLTLDDLLALDGVLRRVDFLEAETIFEEGSVGDDFYIISEGEVSVRTGGAKGEGSVERARLQSGEFFGEMALFDDEPRSATCVAATACTLLVLDRGRFYGLIEQMPQLGLAICKTLSQRLRRTERDLRAASSAKSA